MQIAHEMILKNEEQTLVNQIRNLKQKHLRRLFGDWAPNVKLFLKNIETLEDVHPAMHEFVKISETNVDDTDGKIAMEMARRVAALAYDVALEKQNAKLALRAQKQERKLANRITYQMETVLRRSAVIRDGEIIKERWLGDTDLKAPGLMRLAANERWGNQEFPPVFAIQNHLPQAWAVNKDGDMVSQRPDIASYEFNRINDFGATVSGARIAWTEAHPVHQWLLETFPKAIDFRAYNHSLNAPVLCGGFFPELKVKFCHIKTVNAGSNEIISAETDGCGRVHPKHPIFKQLERPGGPCVFQFRFINKQNTFAKGILVPDERCCRWEKVLELGETGHDPQAFETKLNELMQEHDAFAYEIRENKVEFSDGDLYLAIPEVWIDWNQIKGARKGSAQKAAAADKEQYGSGYLGVLQCWDRPRTLKWSFEQLQFIQKNAETIKLIQSFVEEAFENELSDGIQSLLEGIAFENPTLELIIKLIDRINEVSDKQISHLQVDLVKSALIERLQKTLYFIAQGAGINSKQMVAVMDAGVPEGSIVAGSMQPGSDVVVHRFPTLLPQGIMKLTVCKPLPHHLVNGKPLRNAVYMNPADLTDKIQGDSDGDIVGITSDPRALQLAEHVIGNKRIYMVEPEGEKFNTTSASKEGKRYICGNPMGNVGGMCLQQARLLAVGDYSAAIAMAFPYQEAVDSAKKMVNYTNFRLASDLELWTQDEKGRYHFNTRLEKNEIESNKSFDEIIKEWVNYRLIQAGIEDPDEQNVIAWRRGTKKIRPESWVPCEERGKTTLGNLVHYCHDYALETWKKYEDLFDMNIELVDIKDLLYKLMQAHGIKFDRIDIPWWEYMKTLRNEAGLRQYGIDMARAMASQINLENRQVLFDTAKLNLSMNLTTLNHAQIELIWRMELSDIYAIRNARGRITGYTNEAPEHCVTEQDRRQARANNPSHAYLVATTTLSRLFGIETESTCSFLTEENAHRVNAIVDRAMLSEEPEKKLVEMIHNSTLHAKEIKDENGQGVHGAHCAYCNTILHNALVLRIRKTRAAHEHQFIRKIVSTLNS